MDLGAKEPFCTDTTDNFQEGTIFPGVRLYRAGVRQEDIYRILLANSRLPDALTGDLNAQIIGAEAGIRATLRLIERYGLADFREAVDHVLDHGEDTMRRFLRGIPEGRYTASGALDSDGISDALVPFEITVEVGDDDVTIDFESSPPEQAGPINCPLPTTVSAARLAIIALSGSGDSVNEGSFRPIAVRTRERTMFHPLAPAPIYLYGWPAAQAIDVIHRALSRHAAGGDAGRQRRRLLRLRLVGDGHGQRLLGGRNGSRHGPGRIRPTATAALR